MPMTTRETACLPPMPLRKAEQKLLSHAFWKVSNSWTAFQSNRNLLSEAPWSRPSISATGIAAGEPGNIEAKIGGLFAIRTESAGKQRHYLRGRITRKMVPLPGLSKSNTFNFSFMRLPLKTIISQESGFPECKVNRTWPPRDSPGHGGAGCSFRQPLCSGGFDGVAEQTTPMSLRPCSGVFPCFDRNNASNSVPCVRTTFSARILSGKTFKAAPKLAKP